MLRRLSAIEIAEGALLADICVIFQLLVTYLPVGGDFFRVLIFVVFAILVLRRGLYVGIMAMFVAVFITGIVTGPLLIMTMLLECIGGLFLGIAMRHRMRAISLLLLGITGGAFTLYFVVLGSYLLVGLPFTTLIRGLHLSYTVAISVIQSIAASFGLQGWWQHTIYPPVAALAAFGFTYWWALFYVALWCLLCPFVAVIYATTNTMVRLLGYDVRPLPGGKRARRRLRRIQRAIIKYRRRHNGQGKRGKQQHKTRQQKQAYEEQQNKQSKQEAGV